MRGTARIVLVAAAAAVLGLGVVVAVDVARPRQAGAVESETYPLPASGEFSVTGKGFGHGRGMSQWGSQGAALQGASGSQILAFYYPGTVTTTVPAAPIRVLISGNEGSDTTLAAQAGLAVRDVASGALYALPPAAQRWRGVHDAAGMHIDAYDGSAWSRWTAPDGRSTWAGPLRFGAGAAAITTLYIGQTPTSYRGSLTAVPTGTTTVSTVNTVDLDLYLRSVVPAESPASWRSAALRSQAVAARTYAAYGRARGAGKQWDTCDTTACQVYKGISSEAASTTTAVRDTANQIRTLGGQPILAEFSASNGGYTAKGGPSYQVAKPDPYDAAGGANPSTTWNVTLTTAEVNARYPQVGTPTALRVVTRSGAGAWRGRITDLYLDGTAGSAHLTGDDARVIFKSTWWIPTPTITGPATAGRYATVTLTGTARAGATVAVWFHKRDVAGYQQRRTLVADAAGRWSTTYLASDDHRYYAVSYGIRSNVGLTQIPH